MIVNSIERGIVIDHITAGKAMTIYKLLKLDRLDCSVAIIKNAQRLTALQASPRSLSSRTARSQIRQSVLCPRKRCLRFFDLCLGS